MKTFILILLTLITVGCGSARYEQDPLEVDTDLEGVPQDEWLSERPPGVPIRFYDDKPSQEKPTITHQVGQATSAFFSGFSTQTRQVNCVTTGLPGYYKTTCN